MRRMLLILLVALLPVACDRPDRDPVDEDGLRDGLRRALQDPKTREQLREVARENPQDAETAREFLRGEKSLDDALEDVSERRERKETDGDSEEREEGKPGDAPPSLWTRLGSAPFWIWIPIGLAAAIVLGCLVDLLKRLLR